MKQNLIELTSIETPFYLYDLDLLERTLAKAVARARRHGFVIHYAIKANHEPAILRSMKNYGLGIDCVSGNEVKTALDSGFTPASIVFAGVGKSDREIELALENDIFCINCESIEELEVIAEIATRMQKTARLALRVNPGVDALTHRHITTGLEENKFGIPLSQLRQALELCRNSPWVRFMGLHFHIGSQITSQEPFVNLCQRVNQIWQDFDIISYGGHILNMGGGLGVDYQNPEENPMPDFTTFFQVIARKLQLPRGVKVHFELGRSLVAQCGKLITRVLYVKKGENRQFVITDAGMTELLRPALYQASHRIENLESQLPEKPYDVVGPVCESSDVFARGLMLPETSRGQLLAIHSCGAYAQSMSLRYNQRSPAKASFIRHGKLITSHTSQAGLLQALFVQN